MGSDIDGNDVELSKRSIKNIMHKHSGRISDDAAIRMALTVEREVDRLTRAAKVIAESDGRKTIKEEDIYRVQRIADIFDGDE